MGILVLPFGLSDMARLRPDADFVAERYRTRFVSVYETNGERILRGLLGQDLLATHLGARQADVRAPHRTPYDIAPDVEVRTVQRPSRIEWWADVALILYLSDVKKTGRRWVLAMIDFDRWDVRYLGWQTGPGLLLPEPVETQSREGKTYRIAGMVFPDQLRSMDTFLRKVK
jgi:hypothetical protein